MFKMTIEAPTSGEFIVKLRELAASFGGLSGKQAEESYGMRASTRALTSEGGISEEEARRIAGGTATVSAADPKKTAAAKKAAEKAAAERAAAEAAAAAEAEAETEVDPLADDAPAETEETAYTIDDVRLAMTDLKNAATKNPTIINTLMKEFGVARLAEIPEAKYAALMGRVKAEMAKAK